MKVGEILAGRYELIEQIGSGRCSLFVAHDRQTSRRVAVKIFDSAHVTPEALQRYSALLAAAASVDHPAVVVPRVQIATFETPPFVVGELLQGESLGSLCSRLKTVPWERALAITRDLIQGLAALLAATGAPHRALRPGNVWLAPGEQTQVLDFGIAELGANPTHVRSDGSHVEYRSPEQLEGSPGDARSDIFSLGVMLFEMLTGVHPFAGTNAAAVKIKVLMHAAPRPSNHASHVQLPPALDALVGRMLARRARDRPVDLAGLACDLVGLIPTPPLAAAEDSVVDVPTDTPPPMSARRDSELSMYPAVGDAQSRRHPDSIPKEQSSVARQNILPNVHLLQSRPTTPERTLLLPTDGDDDKPSQADTHRASPDTTLILPEERTDPAMPFRLVDRTLALPISGGKDPEEQVTLKRVNPHHQSAKRIEVLQGPDGRSLDRQNPTVDRTEVVVRAPDQRDPSGDITVTRLPRVQRHTPFPETTTLPNKSFEKPRRHEASTDEDITTFRPKPRVVAPIAPAADLLTKTEPFSAEQDKSQDVLSTGEENQALDAAERALMNRKLILLNVVLVTLLFGVCVLTR